VPKAAAAAAAATKAHVASKKDKENRSFFSLDDGSEALRTKPTAAVAVPKAHVVSSKDPVPAAAAPKKLKESGGFFGLGGKVASPKTLAKTGPKFRPNLLLRLLCRPRRRRGGLVRHAPVVSSKDTPPPPHVAL